MLLRKNGKSPEEKGVTEEGVTEEGVTEDGVTEEGEVHNKGLGARGVYHGWGDLVSSGLSHKPP